MLFQNILYFNLHDSDKKIVDLEDNDSKNKKMNKCSEKID